MAPMRNEPAPPKRPDASARSSPTRARAACAHAPDAVLPGCWYSVLPDQYVRAVVLVVQLEMSETHEKNKQIEEEEEVEEDEYVLLELDHCLYSDISPGAPFVLSGLDTLTPTLTVGDGLKMIGEYEETVGTCYLFSESAEPKPPSDETTPSDVTTDKPASSSKEAPSKEVNHLASVQKILKFRPINAEASTAQSISG
ncbi:uncharacterized protein LOC112899111 isoform X2 [Panicum hallii]|uniref:uncharacterized protein LOC112899111 isoform X2 n=1 Tax=Panicum hallii TaxID=206008 RepID=UPI000DF4D48B|nr:uncharacterized protein LOC112899111 isoform X2 [Panicum hallii]